MRTRLGKAWAWVLEPGDSRRLAALRIALALTLAVRLARGLYGELAGQPAPLFRPLSYMSAFEAMPGTEVTAVVQALGVASALLAAAGLGARFTLPAAWAAGLFLNGMHTSIGKVMHNDVLLMLAMVPLLPVRTSDTWSVDALLGRGSKDRMGVDYGWPVRTSMLVVAGAYFFAGLAKLIHSGPAWVLGDNMRFILYASSDAQQVPNILALFIADRALLARAVAAGTLIVELGFPLALLRARWAIALVAGAVLLHAGIAATMRLDYAAWVATAVVVFIAGWWRVDRFKDSRV